MRTVRHHRFRPAPALSPLAFAALLVLGAPPAAFAQAAAPAADGGTQTIEVTARRRVETQFDVPASVTAIGGAELKATGITSIEDMVSLVPNANMTENPRGFDTYISIRGMRQADASAEPNFGMYRNGMFAGGHRVNLGSQVDVARIEIVRGPQGGLYGRDAVGGAVNVVYVMPKPGDSAGGYATASLENTGTRFEGAATLPVNEGLAVRGTAWALNQRKGDYTNITLDEEIDRGSDRGLRLSAAADLAPSLSALVTFEASKATSPSLRTYAPNGVPNGPAVRSPAETRRTVQRDTSSRNDIDQNYLAGRLSWNLGGSSLTLLASLRHYTLDAVQDLDQTALQPSAGLLVLKQVLTRSEDIRQKYAELLWESDPAQALSGRAGLSYFHEDFDLVQFAATQLDTQFLGGFGIPNLGVLGGSAGLPGPGSGTGTASWSAFVDLRYEFTKALAATATLRRTVDEQRLHWSQGIDPSGNPVTSALFANSVPTFVLDSRDKSSFTAPALGLEYRASKEVNTYALYSTGFRPGGYNTSVTNPAYIPYDQESARNVEAGLKTQWLDGRLGFNLAAFRMTQKDLAVQQDDPGDNTFGFSYLANVGRARTTGFELEALARPDRAWNLAFSVGHLNAKYTEGTINAGTTRAVDVTGRELQGVRPWTINGRVDWRQPVGGVQLAAGIGVRREISGKQGDASDQPLESITTVDLHAGVTLASKTQIGAYVRNATDEIITLFRFSNGAVGTNTGRRFGVQVIQPF